MSEDEYEYVITSKMPAWMRAFLAEMGIEREFTIDELTDKQVNAILTAVALKELVEMGEVEVIYDPKYCPSPRFRLKRRNSR